MATSAKPKANAPSNKGGDDFEAVAKRLQCDEDKARFEAKLGKLAKAKPAAKR